MFQRVGLPLIVLVVLVILFVLFIIVVKTRQRQWDNEEVHTAERDWDGVCLFDNPETGAKCTRTEFHLENHYHDLGNGKLAHWV